jgi:hypothetical protein
MLFFFSPAVWTQGFIPARQMLYLLSHIFGPFCSSYLGDWVLLFVQASLELDPPILWFLSSSWDYRLVPPCPPFSVEMGVSQTCFPLGLPGTTILLISASLLARIIDLSHQCLATNVLLIVCSVMKARKEIGVGKNLIFNYYCIQRLAIRKEMKLFFIYLHRLSWDPHQHQSDISSLAWEMLFCVCALWETGKRTSAGIPKGLRSLCSFALEVCIRK